MNERTAQPNGLNFAIDGSSLNTMNDRKYQSMIFKCVHAALSAHDLFALFNMTDNLSQNNEADMTVELGLWSHQLPLAKSRISK